MSNGQDKTRRMRLWDAPVRLFHWALVITIAVAWWSNQQANIQVHEIAGYTALSLVLFRVIWGLVGSANARFSSFVRGPDAVVGYLKKLPKGSEKELAYPGHNPAGGWMVVVLLTLVGIQAFTGLFASEDTFLFFDGPLVKHVPAGFASAMNSLHHININLIYIAVALHVVAAVGYLVFKRENLIGAMITGRRKVPDDMADTYSGLWFRSGWVGFAILVLCAAVVATMVVIARGG